MKNKRSFGTIIITTSLFLSFLNLANAGVPRHIAYQGVLKNSDGTPLVGPVNIVFRLYKQSTGGESLFAEEHKDVPLINGVYSVHIGAGNELETENSSGGIPDQVLGESQLWLGESIFAESIDDGEELKPRLEIGSSLFALKSHSAEQLVKPGSSETSVIVNENGNVGIGTTTPETKLEVNGVIRTTPGTRTKRVKSYHFVCN